MRILLLTLLLCFPVVAQETHHHEGQTEAVDRFYSTWMMPDVPTQSCCNKLDCYSSERVEYRNRHWWFLHRETGKMVMVPDYKIELNRDNPDGRNHVCANPEGFVYCFILGTGI